jgi:uncharacterized membrane protein
LLARQFFYLCLRRRVLWRGAITAMASGVLACGLLWLAGVYPAPTLLDDHLPYYFLLGFAEAWLNGALITLMVVYCRTGWQLRRPTLSLAQVNLE